MHFDLHYYPRLSSRTRRRRVRDLTTGGCVPAANGDRPAARTVAGPPAFLPLQALRKVSHRALGPVQDDIMHAVAS